MKDEIRIRLSVGLIAVAVIHAVLLGAVFTALPAPSPAPQEATWKLPPARPVASPAAQIEKLQEPQRVNLGAQGEMKQQFSQPCRPCPPEVQPTVQPYRTVPIQPVVQPANAPSMVNPAPAVRPSHVTPASSQNVLSVPAPIFVPPASSSKPTPARKQYQIALFVGSDAKSQQLLDWFNRDNRLAKLKSACEFQVYTAGNALYRTRFEEIVPVSQFPVVLFQDANGGHVHAAGHTMLPATAGELYDDLRHGYELYQQTRQAQRTGALKTRGYSWDDAISPTLQLSSQDCPDGYCPVEPSDNWRPFDRDRDVDRDRLFDRDPGGRSALIWAEAGELATLALIIVAIILLGFILIKRGM